ncbi:MAG TPA: pitrilysin family protein [Terriglobia bacterium]|nr:pitrilysin family protein [Terriglobia bacterium]
MWKLLILLLLQAGAPPQREIAGPYTSREDQGQTTKVVLKNGLTVIVREEYAVPLAGITTLVKVGYFNEEDRLSGVSHVVEHMFFRTTANRPAGQIGRDTRAIGGVLNAYTDYDRTVYSTVVPAANILAALEIQADALRRPSFDAEELKREIEVVLQENRGTLDTPRAVAAGKLYETAFVGHRMKRWKLGSPDGLLALTPDDLAAYRLKYYQPSNTVLTIVGAFDREKILEGVVRLYGDAENSAVEPDTSPAEPPQGGFRYASLRGPFQQAYIALGFHVPGILSDDARALEVLASILGTGRSSRLNQILRDEKNLITDSSAKLQAFREMGYFEVELETSSSLEATTAALAEIENVKRFGVSGEAVGRAKAAIAQNYFGRLETVDGVGDDLASYEAFGDWKLTSAYLSDIQKVTPQRVMDVARKYLTFTNLGVFEYLPESIGRNLSAAEYQAAVLDKVEAAVLRRNEEELPVTAQIPQRGNGLVTDAVGAIRRQSILRGPDVYILEDHRLPLVSFGILFPGGRLLETERNAGITELALRSALRGTKRSDSASISRRLENAGVRLEVVNEPDFFGYTLHGLAGRMDQAIQVLVEVLQEPLFEEPEVASERSLQLNRIRTLPDDNVALPVNLFMQSLFGDHAYGRPAVGTEDGIAKLTGTEVRAWFQSNQRKLLPTIFIVGDTRGTALVAPIAEVVTNEDLEPRDLLTLPRAQSSRQTGQSVVALNRQQTALVYGFSGMNRSANERYAFDLLASVVSGRGGRFFDAIRDKQGWADTIRTTNSANARGGAFYTYVAVSPEKESDVRAALEAEHAKLRTDGVGSDELEDAVQFAVGAQNTSLQTRESRVLEYARAVFSGAGVQSVARYETAIRAVSAEQLKSLIQRYLAAEAVRVGVVRGRAR